MRRLVAAAVMTLLGSVAGVPAHSSGAVPALSKVFVIMEENTDYSSIVGPLGQVQAPYFNSLADAHVRHDAFYGISHVSLGNYIGLVSGQIPSALDHADCPPYPLCLRPGPTIGKQLDDAGKTWRGYFQSMASPCLHPTGMDQYQKGYATRHNPFVYFTDVVGWPVAPDTYCAEHDVPYEGNFAADLAAGPRDYNLIVPNTCDDGHDTSGCGGTTLQVLDRWLQANVPPILDYLATDPHAALFITFDEASIGDTTGCCDQAPRGQGGGHIGFVMVAPGLERAGFKDTVPANLYSLLRTIEDGMGLAPLGEAGSPLIAPMSEMFA